MEENILKKNIIDNNKGGVVGMPTRGTQIRKIK